MNSQQNELEIEILETKILDEIPSASGIVKSNSDIYMIGDNSPFLFKLDENLQVLSKTPIYSIKDLIEGTIVKKLKPDFEALELVGTNKIIVFGSGSKSPERNYFIVISLGEALEVKTYNIASFYDNLKKMEVLQNQELNIEAVAVHNNILYLFNRRKNIIFSLGYDTFMQYVEGQASFPKPKVIVVDLPKINGIEAGFSGATIALKAPNLIFTASVENTNNAYDDGEVLGSFIGLIDLANIESTSSYRYTLIEAGNKPVKVESVTVQNEISANEADLLVTTDSDGDKSVLFKCRFRW